LPKVGLKAALRRAAQRKVGLVGFFGADCREFVTISYLQSR